MKRKNKKWIAALLSLILLCSVVYTSVSFASDISEETESQEETKNTETDITQVIEEQPEEESVQEAEKQPEEDSHTYAAENYFDASGTSTNAHFNVKGIFVDSSNNAYLILFLEKNSNQKEIVHIVVNGKQINSPSVDHWNKSVTIDLPGDESKTLQSTYGILVIEAGSVTNLQEEFLIDIKTTAGGWDITGLKVCVDIDYSIKKTVNPKTANIGDTLTYTITISNDGKIALHGVNVTDTVPDGLKILSVNSSDQLDWQTEGEVLYLDQDVTLEVGKSKTYTVEAEVSKNAAPGQMTNLAVIGGSVIPKEATADVVIKASHTVTIKKVVKGNLGDQSKKFQFTAVVKHSDGEEKHSFSLKNGESLRITDVPDGSIFTLKETEENENGYQTSYEWSVDQNSWSDGASKTISKDTIFKVTNEKNGVINTGMDLDSLPYILILVIVFTGSIVLVMRKYRRS